MNITGGIPCKPQMRAYTVCVTCGNDIHLPSCILRLWQLTPQFFCFKTFIVLSEQRGEGKETGLY